MGGAGGRGRRCGERVKVDPAWREACGRVGGGSTDAVTGGGAVAVSLAVAASMSIAVVASIAEAIADVASAAAAWQAAMSQAASVAEKSSSTWLPCCSSEAGWAGLLDDATGLTDGLKCLFHLSPSRLRFAADFDDGLPDVLVAERR